MGGRMVQPDYQTFLESRRFADLESGHAVELSTISDELFDWQKAIVRWAIRRGRAAIFADTGLGKTRMQVEWARHVPGSVLILAPLAVAQQTVHEARQIGCEVIYARHQTDIGDVFGKIIITNYEMMDHFDFGCFTGIVLDESSILKSHDSKTRGKLIDAAQQCAYRLSCTATPSPNDFMELGNQSEFLGVMSRSEMLSMFFIHDGGDTSKWRLKGHGKIRFWEWMATWAVVVRKPSDIGYDDAGYDLPPLNIHKHLITVEAEPLEGQLFPGAAVSLMERRQANRLTRDVVTPCAECSR